MIVKISKLILLGIIAFMPLFLLLGKYIALIVSLIIILMLFLVILEGNKDILSPLNFLTIMIFFNVYVRYVWIDFIYENRPLVLEQFLLKQDYNFLINSSLIVLVSIFALFIGYISFKKKIIKRIYKIKVNKINIYKAKKIVIIYNLMGLIALIEFINITLGFASLNSSTISSFRGVTTEIQDYNAYGYLRLLISLSSISLYISFALINKYTEHKTFFINNAILGFIITLVMSVFSSSRAALVFTFLNLFFIRYYLNKGTFEWGKFLIIIPIFVILFYLLTMLRPGSGYDFEGNIDIISILLPIIVNIGGIDISKTGHIIDFITIKNDYELGATLFSFILLAIPRSLWQNKPVNLDTYIGINVYDANVFGSGAVPPGLIAEMYMNFSWLGILIGCFSLGVIIKQMNFLSTNAFNSLNWCLFYVLVLLNFSVGLLGSGVSSTLIGMFMVGFPLLIALKYIKQK